jgi:lycopene cyclase domain-containing protein
MKHLGGTSFTSNAGRQYWVAKTAYTYAMYLLTLGALFALAVWLELRFRVHLYHTRKERVLITLIFFVIGVAWDSISTIEKTWVYPGNGLIGIWIGVLPIEEYLFSLVVPFWILIVYKVLEAKLSATAVRRKEEVGQ